MKIESKTTRFYDAIWGVKRKELFRERPPKHRRAFPLSKFWGRATGASDVLRQRASYLNDVTRIFNRLHLPTSTIAQPQIMADRANKRLRRLSTEYEDSEDNNEWNNSRYVADIPSTARDSAPFRAKGSAARHKAANWSESKQSAAGSSVTSQCYDRSPPCRATCAVILTRNQQKELAI